MAEEEKASEQSGGSSKGILIALIVLIIVLLIGIGAGVFLFLKNSNSSPQEASAPQAANSNPAVKGTHSASIEDLVLNVTSSKGKEKLMKFSLTLKSSEEKVTTQLAENMAEVVDYIIAIVSSRTSEELLTVGGKELLKEEMIQGINEIFDDSAGEYQRNNVKNIFFTDFVIK